MFLASLASEPQLKDLVLELRHIHGWFHLGICLGIPRSILDQIHESYGASLNAMGQCKMQLLGGMVVVAVLGQQLSLHYIRQGGWGWPKPLLISAVRKAFIGTII